MKLKLWMCHKYKFSHRAIHTRIVTTNIKPVKRKFIEYVKDRIEGQGQEYRWKSGVLVKVRNAGQGENIIQQGENIVQMWGMYFKMREKEVRPEIPYNLSGCEIM